MYCGNMVEFLSRFCTGVLPIFRFAHCIALLKEMSVHLIEYVVEFSVDIFLTVYGKNLLIG